MRPKVRVPQRIDIRCILKRLELSLIEFPNEMLNIAETPLAYHNWAEDQIEFHYK